MTGTARRLGARITCPDCGRSYAPMKGSPVVRRHPDPSGPKGAQCSGSYKMPVERAGGDQ